MGGNTYVGGGGEEQVGSVVPLAALFSVPVVYVHTYLLPMNLIPIHWRCMTVYLERTTVEFEGDSTVGISRLEY